MGYGFGHALQGVGREPSLDEAGQRSCQPDQWMGRAGEGGYFVEDGVVGRLPLYCESLFSAFYVAW